MDIWVNACTVSMQTSRLNVNPISEPSKKSKNILHSILSLINGPNSITYIWSLKHFFLLKALQWGEELWLGTFPKPFSKSTTSQGYLSKFPRDGYFSKWQLPKCANVQGANSQEYFPKWQLPKCEISQAKTSQVCSSLSARPPSPS